MSKRKVVKTGTNVPSGAQGQNVKDQARQLLSRADSITSGDLARAAQITRQAAHYNLRRMVKDGELRRAGAGRGAHYYRPFRWTRRYATSGLAEEIVWREIDVELSLQASLSETVVSILRYGLTEMVNNAIDHSGSEEVEVSFIDREGVVGFEVVDLGVGVFKHIREQRGLKDEFEAIQELSKGKVTTDPKRHTGEGVFFTSKAMDLFVLASGGIQWRVDNVRGDQSVGHAPPRPGTRVQCQINQASHRVLREVFSAYAGDDYEFSRSRAAVRLFEKGERFVSRSEAKRMAQGLERFEEVSIDFAGVTEVGQGFVDELFRVWAGEHPQTRLLPVSMSEAVAFMVKRGLPPRPPSS